MRVGGLAWFCSTLYSERPPGYCLNHCGRCCMNTWIDIHTNYMIPAGHDLVGHQFRSHRAMGVKRLSLIESSPPICSFFSWGRKEKFWKFLIFMLLFMFTSTWIYRAISFFLSSFFVSFFLKLSVYLWKYALQELHIDISAVTFLKDVFKCGHNVVGVSFNTLPRF